MVGEIYAGLSAFKTMFDLAKGLKDVGDASIRNTAVIELQEMILTAQTAQQALIAEKGELEKEVTRLKDWTAEMQNYQLKDIGNGCLAYSTKPGVQSSEPPHHLCANCYSQTKKRFLQRETKHMGRAIVYACHDCASELYVQGHWYPDQPKKGRR